MPSIISRQVGLNPEKSKDVFYQSASHKRQRSRNTVEHDNRLENIDLAEDICELSHRFQDMDDNLKALIKYSILFVLLRLYSTPDRLWA